MGGRGARMISIRDRTRMKVYGNKVKYAGGIFRLTDFEKGFAEATDLDFHIDPHLRGGKTRDGVRGQYLGPEKTKGDPSVELSYHVVKSGDSHAWSRRIFHHEIGHAIDLEGGKARSGSTYFRGLIYDSGDVLNKEGFEVMRQRVINDAYDDATKKLFTKDFYDQVVGKSKITGSKLERELIGNMKDSIDYLGNPKEVFAESYAQFTESPTKFREYAPNLYDYFKVLVNE